MLIYDKRFFRYFDWVSFLLTVMLLSIGILFVFSSTYTPENPISAFFKKQCFWAFIGFIIYFLFCAIDQRHLARWGRVCFFLSLALLVYIFIGGLVALGARRWASFYFFKFQPSELVKLFLPAFMAGYFSELEVPRYRLSEKMPFKDFLFPLGVLGVSFLLILKQPDLGTALLVLFSGLTLLWFIGLPRKFFLIVGIAGCIGMPVLWKCLKPYQQNRVMVLFGYGDARKERYQIEQSKIAIGSGGVVGKGLLQGTQNKFGFLPEDHTDFIFSVVCEELGFMGAFLVLLLYCLLLSRLLYIVMQIKNLFEQIIAIGLLMHMTFSFCINVGMVTDMLPTVGIPLPLFSYGGTNLWVTMASLGWLNNMAIRRFYY